MGKITSFLSDLISDALKGVIVQTLLGSTFLLLLFLGFKDFLLQSVSVKLVIIIPVTILAFGFLASFCAKYFYRRKYLIPVRRTHHEDIEINEYSRRTKWNYKSHKKYYFIPLISHSQYSADFVTFAGPFCAGCDQSSAWFKINFYHPDFSVLTV